MPAKRLWLIAYQVITAGVWSGHGVTRSSAPTRPVPSGLAHALAASERLPALADVPTAVELAASAADRALLRFYALKFNMARPLLVPPEVPAERTAALQAAFAATMQDARYLDEARRIGLDVNWLGAEDIAAQVRQIGETPQPVVDRLRELLARASAK